MEIYWSKCFVPPSSSRWRLTRRDLTRNTVCTCKLQSYFVEFFRNTAFILKQCHGNAVSDRQLLYVVSVSVLNNGTARNDQGLPFNTSKRFQRNRKLFHHHWWNLPQQHVSTSRQQRVRSLQLTHLLPDSHHQRASDWSSSFNTYLFLTSADTV